jgi:hypothetical protein
VQSRRQLGDGDHEDEVEEELGPGRVPLGPALARFLQAQEGLPQAQA